MENRKQLTTLFLAGVFTLTGCGSETDSNAVNQKELANSSNTQLIEPCELVTKVEAGKIMGSELKEGQYSEQKIVGSKMCLYEAEDENSFAFFQISVSQAAFMPHNMVVSGQSSKTLFAATKKAFADKRIDIKDMADDAFIAIPGMHILKGDYYITIALGNTDQNKERLKTAGAKAVTNLEAALK